MHAWVDESIHLEPVSGGIYVLAATIGDAGLGLDEMRDVLKRLRRGPRRRLHWHVEDDHTRFRVIGTIAELSFDHLAVVRVGVDPKRQERARRKCLERLLFELSCRGVGQVWLESRTGRLNQSDVKLVDVVRSRGDILEPMQVGFARPLDEPMLWLPDAVAGAVAFASKGRTCAFREALESKLQEIEV